MNRRPRVERHGGFLRLYGVSFIPFDRKANFVLPHLLLF
ncbi:hypothetical protein J2T14_005541 [Paenibacillus harenae]|nr:hypothetical protein [Paenibacillus harenae]